MPSNDHSPIRDDDEAAPARLAVLLVLVFVLIAGIMGLVSGSFTIEHFKPTVPPKSSPITVP